LTILETVDRLEVLPSRLRRFFHYVSLAALSASAIHLFFLDWSDDRRAVLSLFAAFSCALAVFFSSFDGLLIDRKSRLVRYWENIVLPVASQSAPLGHVRQVYINALSTGDGGSAAYHVMIRTQTGSISTHCAGFLREDRALELADRLANYLKVPRAKDYELTVLPMGSE
jgi:hypothetical protein